MTTPLTDAIALNRDSKVAVPDFRFPLLPSIDEAHCSAWGRQLTSLGTAWEVRKATPELWNQIPSSAGLYMFVWKIPVGFTVDSLDKPHYFRHLLYCGQAGGGTSRNTLKQRYKAEYAHYLKGDPSALFDADTPTDRKAWLGRWLLLQPLEYWWTEVEDKVHLSGMEKELIRILAPPLNTQHKILRVATRRPAF